MTSTYSADHANETHANAVDYDLIEPSKENIQPLKQGRNPHMLLKALQPFAPPVKDASSTVGVSLAPGRTEASVKAERKTFEQAIKSYPADGLTPLQPWLAYISWTQQSYTSVSLKSHLLELLEKCTRTFLRDERVKNELKYLHVWFMYMDLVEDPLDMFSFLHTNQICLNHAKLYEGWSLLYEHKGRLQEACDTLQLGLNYGAEPKSNLRNSITRLQARIAKDIAKKVAVGIDLNATESQPAKAQRLADENGTVSRQPLQAISNNSGSFREPLAQRAINGQTIYDNAPIRPSIPPAKPTYSATSSNFQIFCDDAAPPSNTVAIPFANVTGKSSASSSSSSSATTHWREYAPANQINKENQSSVSTWTAPLQPAATPSNDSVIESGTLISLPPSVASFAIFQDEECAQEEAEKERQRAKQRAREAEGPRQRLDGPSTATLTTALKPVANDERGSKLLSNPLQNMKK